MNDSENTMKCRILLVLSFIALALTACGDATDPAEPELTQETVDGPAPSPKADAPMLATEVVDFEPARKVLEVEDRRVITSADAFEQYFGAAPPSDVDFSREWIVFYTPGLQQTGGFEASIQSVQYAKSGQSIQIVTRLDSPGVDCQVQPYEHLPYTVVAFTRPNVRPQSVRYYTDDTATTCGAEACELEFLEDVVPAIDGVLFSSEGDEYWDPLFYPGSGDALENHDALLVLFEEPADEYIQESDFDELIDSQYFIPDPESASEWELEIKESYTRIREALETQLDDIRVYRVGEVEVRIYVVGRTSCGDLAGISTLSIET